jgi:hypothetical protein
MSIDATGDVGGVGGPQGPTGPAKAQLEQQKAVTIEVFSILLSILGQFSKGVSGSLVPQIEQEKVWQSAAAGIVNILTLSPGTLTGKPPKYAGGKLTDAEVDQFADGWQMISWAYGHQNGKVWKSMSSYLKSWVTAIMKQPKFADAFSKLYQAIKKLQQLENQGAPKSEITAQKNKMLGDVAALQGLATSKDSKVALEFKQLLTKTQGVQQFMAGIAALTVVEAMKAVKFITAMTKTISVMIKRVEQVKQTMASAGIS